MGKIFFDDWFETPLEDLRIVTKVCYYILVFVFYFLNVAMVNLFACCSSRSLHQRHLNTKQKLSMEQADSPHHTQIMERVMHLSWKR